MDLHSQLQPSMSYELSFYNCSWVVHSDCLFSPLQHIIPKGRRHPGNGYFFLVIFY
jgi:hypothetical protein